MRNVSITFVLSCIAISGCSAGHADSEPEKLATSRFAATAAPRVPDGAGDPCANPGVYIDADGDYLVCYEGGVSVAVGDVTGDGVGAEIELVVATNQNRPLPPLHVIPEGASVQVGDGRGVISDALAVSIVPQGAEVPDDVMPPNCDGVMVDTATGDVWICAQGIGLLLPAVQKVRDAAANASGAGMGAGKVVMFGGARLVAAGGTEDINIGIGEMGHATATPDGLMMIVGATTLAARAKADIIVESR